jgi:hypothetical protein
VPAKAGNDTIALALVLDFEHRALVRFVGSRTGLSDDAVETSALEATKPILRHEQFAGYRGEVYWRRCGRKQRFQNPATISEFQAAEIPVSLGKNIE